MPMGPDPARAGAARRLLVINPNGNPAVTAQIRRVAERVLPGDTAADVVNPDGAPRSIESPADRAAAEPRVIEMIEAAAGTGYAGYVLACFDDIAIAAARGLAAVPVVGAFDASLALARTFAQRFAIVTTVESAVPGIHRLLERHGASESCSVRAAGIGVAAAAELDRAARARLDAAIDAAVEQDGAQAVILGSGGLAGHGSALAIGRSIHVIDSIQAAIMVAAAAAASQDHAAAPAGP